MKSPSGLSAVLFGGWCWFISSIASAAMPHNHTLSSEIPATPPASDVAAFRSIGDDESPLPATSAALPATSAADSFCYRWQVWASALFLTRSGAGDLPLAFGDPGDPKGSEVFGSGDLDFGFGWGPNVGVARCFNQCNSIGVEFYRDRRLVLRGPSCGKHQHSIPQFSCLA